MQVVITAAGKGERFKQAGFQTSKILVPFFQRPAILNVLDRFPSDWKKFLVVANDFENLQQLELQIAKSKRGCRLIQSRYSAKGPIDTVKAALPYLISSEPVLSVYGDVALDWDPFQFQNRMSKFDFGFINYSGFHPTYLGPNSYCHVKLNSDQSEVIEIGEKKRFTSRLQDEITSAGYYYFRSAALLADGLMNLVATDHSVAGSLVSTNEYYISQVIQSLKSMDSKYKIGNYKIEHLLQMGTPADKHRADFWENYFKINQSSSEIFENENQENKIESKNKSLVMQDLSSNINLLKDYEKLFSKEGTDQKRDSFGEFKFDEISPSSLSQTFELERSYWRRLFDVFQ